MAAIVGLEELKYPCAAAIVHNFKHLFDAMTKQVAKTLEGKRVVPMTTQLRARTNLRVPNVDLWERLL